MRVLLEQSEISEVNGMILIESQRCLVQALRLLLIAVDVLHEPSENA
jgi:hypothetical protein